MTVCHTYETGSKPKQEFDNIVKSRDKGCRSRFRLRTTARMLAADCEFVSPDGGLPVGRWRLRAKQRGLGVCGSAIRVWWGCGLAGLGGGLGVRAGRSRWWSRSHQKGYIRRQAATLGGPWGLVAWRPCACVVRGWWVVVLAGGASWWC